MVFQRNKLPTSFEEWELFEFTGDAILYRHTSHTAWLVVCRDTENAAIFVTDDYPRFVTVEALGLLTIIDSALGWGVGEVDDVYEGDTQEAYEYASLS